MAELLTNPFERIIEVGWGVSEPVETYFFIRSGEDAALGIHGAGGEETYIVGSDPPEPGSINLIYVNPSDPAWVATCGVFVTIHGVSSPSMQFAWTGEFLDTRAGEEDPNEMPWLDGLVLTIEGYGTLPPFGAADPFLGLFRQTYDGFRTTYNWTNFPDTGAIDPLPLSDLFVSEDGGPEKIQITYPGWEEYFNTTTGP